MFEWKKWWTQGEVYCPWFRFSLKSLTTGDNTTKFARLCFWMMLSAKTNISVLQSQLDRLSVWHHLTAHYSNKSLKYAWLAWHARKRGKFIRVQDLGTNKKEMPESKGGHIYSICWVNRKYPPPPLNDSTLRSLCTRISLLLPSTPLHRLALRFKEIVVFTAKARWFLCRCESVFKPNPSTRDTK